MGMGNLYSYHNKSDLYRFLREQKQALDADFANLNGISSLIELRYHEMNSLGKSDPADRKRRQELYDEIQRLRQDKNSIKDSIANHKSAIEDIKRALNSP